MPLVDAQTLSAEYADRNLLGVCALCLRLRTVRLCKKCHAVFCSDCRGRYFARGIAFIHTLLGQSGTHGRVFQE